RRGDLDRARELLGELRSHPADPWHGGLVAAAAAEVHLAAGEWADAAAEARSGLSPPAGGEVPFPWRLAWLLCRAEAESALDAIARKQAAGPAALTAELQELIGALRLRT